MSIACQKNYSILIAGSGAAFWKFDESGDPRIDVVNGFSLSTFDGHPAGSSPGLIGKAAHFPTTGADMANTGGAFAFPYSANNLSWTFWIQATANNTGGSFFCQLSWTNFSIGAFFESGVTPILTIGTQTQPFLINLGTLSLNQWAFVSVTYNQSTNTISASLNNGVPVTAHPATQFSLSSQLTVNATGSGAGYDMLLDEMLVAPGYFLNANQISALFRCGYGTTWPAVQGIINNPSVAAPNCNSKYLLFDFTGNTKWIEFPNGSGVFSPDSVTIVQNNIPFGWEIAGTVPLFTGGCGYQGPFTNDPSGLYTFSFGAGGNPATVNCLGLFTS